MVQFLTKIMQTLPGSSKLERCRRAQISQSLQISQISRSTESSQISIDLVDLAKSANVNECSLRNIGFDAAEKEPARVCCEGHGPLQFALFAALPQCNNSHRGCRRHARESRRRFRICQRSAAKKCRNILKRNVFETCKHAVNSDKNSLQLPVKNVQFELVDGWNGVKSGTNMY